MFLLIYEETRALRCEITILLSFYAFERTITSLNNLANREDEHGQSHNSIWTYTLCLELDLNTILGR